MQGFFGTPEVGDRVKFRNSFREGIGTIVKIQPTEYKTYIMIECEGLREYAEILINFGKSGI